MSRVARAVAALVLAVLGCGLVGLAWLGTYSRWIADDFCTTAALHRMGFLQSQVYWYKSWSGRFAFTFVMTTLESLGPHVTRVLPAVVIAVLSASIFFAAMSVVANRMFAAALACAISWSIVGCAPDVFQDVFWATGVVTYTLPLALIALWTALMLRNRTTYPLLFLAAAFSETLTVVMAGVAAAAFVGFPSQRRKTAPAIAAIALGALLVAVAPGNAVRASHFRRELSFALFPLIAVDAVTFLWRELSQAASALTLVFVLAATARVLSNEPPSTIRRSAGATMAIALLWCIFAPFLLARAVMSAAAPLRSMQATHAALTVAGAMCGWAAGGMAGDVRRRRSAIALCAMIVVLTGLQIGAIADIRTTAISAGAFARGWDQMDADLRRLREKSFVVVPAPRTVGNLDFLAASPEHWANRCVADCYGAGRVAGKVP
jgi:hypothetical protein